MQNKYNIILADPAWNCRVLLEKRSGFQHYFTSEGVIYEVGNGTEVKN